MRYAIINHKTGFRLENGAAKIYHDSAEAFRDMQTGDQIVALPRWGQTAEFLDKIRRKKQ